ncbi:MAG: phosphoribosylanthranilate isomerase [Chloroflexi bacterium]|nr:phosphoribosylanthranilate isomerase [Chloroflexota bacterium]
MKTRIKICGLTNEEDALVAAEAGADFLGFVFYPKSPRYVKPEQVQKIVASLHARRTACPTLVGVFVDEPVQRVRETLDFCALDLAQLHGSEPPVELRLLAPRAYKALRPQTRGDAEAFVATYQADLPDEPDMPQFLLDAYHPWVPGGTGKQADWHAAIVISRRFRVLLAGGLRPDNVAEAIAAVRPWGVDVSSGVEREPGKKDHRKVRDFVRAVRNAER